MTCKCGARTYKGHLRLVRKGRAASHVYKGAIWLPGKEPS